MHTFSDQLTLQLHNFSVHAQPIDTPVSAHLHVVLPCCEPNSQFVGLDCVVAGLSPLQGTCGFLL